MVESGGTAMYAREEAAAGELLGSLGMLSTDTSNGMLTIYFLDANRSRLAILYSLQGWVLCSCRLWS